MNFAPYQSSPPESTRALSPPIPPHSPKPSPPPLARAQSSIEDPWSASRSPAPLPSPSAFASRRYGDDPEPGAYVFSTSLGLRMEMEAVLAYLLVPPVGGVALLVFERESDYVRFHAWQSCLVFSAAAVLHLVFSWSRGLSWLLFLADLGLMGLLVFRAYRDAETLDRFELPFFGQMASRFVDQE